MSIEYDTKRKTYTVRYGYKDFTGKTKQTTKRGFKTEREAIRFEKEVKLQSTYSFTMTLSSFVELYLQDIKPELRIRTYDNKVMKLNKHVLPYFGDKKLCDITAADVKKWHATLYDVKKIDGKTIKPTYIQGLHTELSAIFNHAVNIYDLPYNPAKKAGNIKIKHKEEMLFWTQEDYKKFIVEVANKEESYMGFQILYWCGIRIGELLALTKQDIDFDTNIITISKSYARHKAKEIFGPPKTPQSYRRVLMPKKVAEELKAYMSRFYKLKDDQRIFYKSAAYYEREIKRGAKQAELKQIVVHGLRHSHVSLLIHKGYQAVEIGKRVGHTSEEITFRYAHMFPLKQHEMVDSLDKELEVMFDE